MASTSTSFPIPSPRRDVIQRFCKKIIKEDSCVEFRVWGANYSTKTGWIESTNFPRTIVGFYDRPDHLFCDVMKLRKVSGYVISNPLEKAFLHRKNNSFFQASKDDCCKDEDIRIVDYFLIDIDPIRKPRKISATHEEHELAMQRRDAILGDYPRLVENSIFGSSGNGAWILVHIGKQNNSDTKNKTTRFLHSMVKKYSDNAVEIDPKMTNYNRHLSIPGTLKCKGEHSEERPWRLVTIDGGGLPGWSDIWSAMPMAS